MSSRESVREEITEKEKDTYGDLPVASSKITGVVGLGICVVVGIFAGLGGWAAIAPIDQAVSAPATLLVKGARKQIQHLEGGIVSNVLVSEGQFVEKGHVLIKLRRLQAGSMASRIRNQMDQAMARSIRIGAELRGDDSVTLDSQILYRIEKNPNLLNFIESEQMEFLARRESLSGQINILEQRIIQFKQQIKGLEVLKKSRLQQIALLNIELKDLRILYEKGFYPRTRVLAIERTLEQLLGTVGADDAEIARAQSGAGEAKSQIISLKQRFHEELVSNRREVQAEIMDLQERLIVAEDILERIEIRAPQSGIIQNLEVHTVGGIVRPGEPLMEIVPQGEELLIAARVAPTDIDNVELGQSTEVRFTALNARTTPILFGEVMSVSGDIINESPSELPYFLVRVRLPEDEREKIGNVRLSAGMPAEVFIKTGERTALQYLIKPLSDALTHGLKEE